MNLVYRCEGSNTTGGQEILRILRAPYIPTAKAGGFTALFGKTQDAETKALLLQTRVRMGQLSLDRLRLAAELGDPIAREMLPGDYQEFDARRIMYTHVDGETWNIPTLARAVLQLPAAEQRTMLLRFARQALQAAFDDEMRYVVVPEGYSTPSGFRLYEDDEYERLLDREKKETHARLAKIYAPWFEAVDSALTGDGVYIPHEGTYRSHARAMAMGAATAALTAQGDPLVSYDQDNEIPTAILVVNFIQDGFREAPYRQYLIDHLLGLL